MTEPLRADDVVRRLAALEERTSILEQRDNTRRNGVGTGQVWQVGEERLMVFASHEDGHAPYGLVSLTGRQVQLCGCMWFTNSNLAETLLCLGTFISENLND